MKKRCMQCMNELNESMVCGVCQFDNATEKNPAHALPMETLLNGKYLIGKVIGEGGFGITYIAWDTLIETVVAIKEYYPAKLVSRNTTMQGNEESRSMEKSLTILSGEYEQAGYKKGLEKFADEAARLAKFNQMPGVVSVKDFFYENNTAYMVMEYIHGVTLKAYLECKKEKISPSTVFQMMEPVIKTLEEIHKQGVIHRDISPDNIMITQDGQLKLIDFGAARFIDANDEKSLTVILKHGYAPEEQYRSNGKQGPWTDVYALCAVMYRMIFGEVAPEVAQRMSEAEDSVLKQIKGEKAFAGQEKSALLKGLAVKTEKRYQSMAKLYSDLYGKKNVWPVVAAGIFGLAIIIFIGRNIEKKMDILTSIETTYETVDVTENVMNDSLEERHEVVEETVSVVETVAYPEYYQAYCEVYNEQYSAVKNNRYFVDLNNDSIDEMVVAYTKSSVSEESLLVFGDDELGIDIWAYDDGSVMQLLQETEKAAYYSGNNYYLGRKDGKKYILKETWKLENSVHKIVKCEQLFLDWEKKISSWNVVDEVNLDVLRDTSFVLNSTSYLYYHSYDREITENDIDIMGEKDALDEVFDIAEKYNKNILDYEIIYDESNKGIFAVAADFSKMDKRILMTDTVKVVFSDFQQLNVVSEIYMGEDVPGNWIEGFQEMQFGNKCHYFVQIAGAGWEEQRKFCYENGKAREIIDENVFKKDAKGYVLLKDFSSSMSGRVDVFYYQDKYVEYGCEYVGIKQFDNYNDILEVIENEIKQTEYFNTAYESVPVIITDVELQQILKSATGYYYLNYCVADTYYEDRKRWVHAIVHKEDNQLVFDELCWKKRMFRETDNMPLYFGTSELVEAGDTDAQLHDLIIAMSGVQYTNTFIIDDFDANYQKEIFAYITLESGSEYSGTTDKGASIWYSDGDSTIKLVDLQDGYLYQDMYMKYRNEKAYCIVERKDFNGNKEETICAVTNGKPCVVEDY